MAPDGDAVLRLLLAYDGAPFHGMAVNAGVRTVAGDVEAALAKVLRRPVTVALAGRTDAGVHGWGQVVSTPLGRDEAALDLARLRHSCNRLLAPSIVVREAELAPREFDARHSAVARRYRYTVLNRPVPDPFLAPTSWWVNRPLDLRALRQACDPFIGEHDFSSFCRKIKDADPTRPPSMSRRVVEARWDDEGDGILRFWIEANAFCHQMVRAIVGTLVEVGAGRRRAGDLAGVLRACDRSVAGPVAPPHGLCLWAVTYPETIDAPGPAPVAGSTELPAGRSRP